MMYAFGDTPFRESESRDEERNAFRKRSQLNKTKRKMWKREEADRMETAKEVDCDLKN